MGDFNKNLHVLICDPNEEKNRELIPILKKFGVRTVQSVPQFQDVPTALERQHPNMIVIGDTFPDVSVEEVMSYLKIEPALKEIPVLLHGAEQSPEVMKGLVSKGLAAVIPNPPDIPGVRHALRNYYRRLKSKEITKLVQECPFFDNFTNDEMRIIAKIAIPRQYQAGETIFQKGDPGNSLNILLQGRIETMVMDGSMQSVAISIQAGEPFGEMAILGHEPRSAFCIAADDCVVLEVGSHILDDSDNRVRLKIFAKLATVLAERLRHMNSVVQSGSSTVAPRDMLVEEEEADGEDKGKNPFAVPTGKADRIDPSVDSQEEYDVLKRKIHLRSDFIVAKLSNQMIDVVCNKMFGYWTGGKLAKVNPHALWNPKSFTPGAPRLKQAMHIVCAHAQGAAGYADAYLGLPFSQRVIGLSNVGCCGTLLGAPSAIDRFLDGKDLESSLQLDLEIPIDRTWRGKECIEFLTHTEKDVRPQTLFLIFDGEDGGITRRFREKYPEHQIVTVIPGYGFNMDQPATLFTQPEEKLKEKKLIVPKPEYKGEGFYAGQTFFFPDLSEFYRNTDKMRDIGYLFGTIGIFARMGPDYSGVTWGSSGGAEGAARAARAMFGMSGAQSEKDIADAISWADN